MCSLRTSVLARDDMRLLPFIFCFVFHLSLSDKKFVMDFFNLPKIFILITTLSQWNNVQSAL